MRAFADLLERLALTPGRLAKIALLRRYFATVPDPDRGFGLASVTGELSFTAAKPAMIRALIEDKTDPELFAWSYDYVGDLAETVALMWPSRPSNREPPSLPEVVEMLAETDRSDLPGVMERWLDAGNASERYALLKLVTGSLRVGASARLAKIALSELSDGRIAPDDIEEVWHGLEPPYAPLFAWLDGGAKPDPEDKPIFRPPMLANPLEAPDLAAIDASAYRAEWKWDGIRVQIVSTDVGRRIYSRGAEDISGTFPDVVANIGFRGVLDGELLVVRDGEIAPFADLQQRLNCKTVSAKMVRDYPVMVRLYDLLFDGHEDVRPLPFDARRKRLEAWFARESPAGMDVSPLLPFADLAALAEVREGARAASIEGLMLKRGDSPYVPGRPKGLWWKWKRDPLTIDAVVMYAQRGHGKRSSFYSDYTFGLWRSDVTGREELVPVGKAYSGLTDPEVAWLDKWIRNNTTGRFGPVREVAKDMVLEIAFDAAQLSGRHKSGVALRFPRIARLRRDKPAAEADRLETLMRTIEVARPQS